MSFVARPICAM